MMNNDKTGFLPHRQSVWFLDFILTQNCHLRRTLFLFHKLYVCLCHRENSIPFHPHPTRGYFRNYQTITCMLRREYVAN